MGCLSTRIPGPAGDPNFSHRSTSDKCMDENVRNNTKAGLHRRTSPPATGTYTGTVERLLPGIAGEMILVLKTDHQLLKISMTRKTVLVLPNLNTGDKVMIRNVCLMI